MMKHDLNDLRLFVDVAAASSYAKASRLTGVSRATLSRRIAGLEEELGLRLIERSSRTFRLTGPGQQLFDRAKDVVAAADAAFDMLEAEGADPQGEVRFAVAPSVLQLRLNDMIADYLAAFPRVSIQIEATNRRVDLLRDGFDFAIRAGETRSGPLDQVILPFASVEHVLVIAPELTPFLRPTLTETLQQVPSLAWAAAAQPASWRVERSDGTTQPINLSPKLAVEDMAALRIAALRGLGIAMMPRIMVEDDLQAGRLVNIELDMRPPAGRIHAVHLGKKGMRPVVRHLLDWLAAAYQGICAPRN
ncbi:LysR family transcriptional regulator [Xinfangfangia sp. CPCC 101601]|uniref:LysR family transcriptional regulator n=1 Tax=Pseudogemmobacter lacusdianii TaxID=3069608 RepID=A0ABU0W2J5_9RHOB|nr:LysR family transcriptional regulator [Xinfangfangia sp. CPCC 101601]MDQ2068240.1 LysR family transcriptional regulator [Xinfangfangia sp. CPCC 101601]